jgi:outer membrane biosynthesis protein TonB
MQSFRPSLAISAIFHAVILFWGLISFTPKPLDTVRTETMAIDLVPISEFTMNKAGSSKAPAKPEKIAETKGDPKELTDLVQKVTEKQEIKAATPPPPVEEKKPPEAKVEDKKPEAKPDPKPDPKEALKKPEPPKKLEPPKEQPKTAAQMKVAPTKQREFDPNKIAALLDRREPQRQKISNEAPPSTSLGINRGAAESLSMSELDAIKRKLMALWNPPVGVENPQELIVTVRFKLKRDGTLDGGPLVMNSGQSQNFMIAREKAIRAIFMAQPFNTLPQEKFDLWHDLEVTFDPREMSGG